MVEIKVFLTFFCWMMEGSGFGYGSVKKMKDPDPGNSPKTYGSDPDPDPQHWVFPSIGKDIQKKPQKF